MFMDVSEPLATAHIEMYEVSVRAESEVGGQDPPTKSGVTRTFQQRRRTPAALTGLKTRSRFIKSYC